MRNDDFVGMMGKGGQADRIGDGNWGHVAVNRQGALIAQDQILEWILAGRGFHTQQGDAMTKLSYSLTTYAVRRPSFVLRVPEGRTIIPLSLRNTIEDAAGNENHLVWSRTTNDLGDGSSSTGLTISAMRTDARLSSACFARGIYAADCEVATGLVEVIRFFRPFIDVSTGPLLECDWNIKNAGMIPIIVGPGSLQLHIIGATAMQGYGEYAWIEFETNMLVQA